MPGGRPKTVTAEQRSARKKAWYEANKGKISEESKARYAEKLQKNPEEVNNYRKAYYEANQKACQERSNKYYYDNYDKSRAQRREYYAAHRDEQKAKQKEWRIKNRSNRRFKKHGITKEQFDKMVAEQESKCAICHQVFPIDKLVIDHDHKTNKVRGLLCNQHNTMIGLAKESIDVFESAIDYVNKHNLGDILGEVNQCQKKCSMGPELRSMCLMPILNNPNSQASSIAFHGA